MFDDYVEHAGSAPGFRENAPTLGLPKLEYQGFEPSSSSRIDEQAVIEGSWAQSEQQYTEAPSVPIFELSRVQYAIPAPLVSLAVASDFLCMGLATNMIIMIELSRPDQVTKLNIQRKVSEMTLHKLFLDPSGQHLIVTSTQGENWYLFRGWKRFKQLKGFKMVIESIAWNKTALLSSTNSTSSREFLVGGRNGTIYEALLDAEEDFFKSQERYIQPVYTLPERQPVTGLQFQHISTSDSKQCVVAATTPTRIYQFFGPVDRRGDENSRVFQPLFSKYRDTPPRILELPGDGEDSELHFYTPNSDQAQSLPRYMVWMTAQGVYHGALNFSTFSDEFIDAAKLLPYPEPGPSHSHRERPNSQPHPISIGLTEFHIVLLYRDHISAVCSLNDTLTYEETLPLKPSEQVRGMAVDPVRRTYWVYTDSSLFELVIGNEDRDVWSIYLDSGDFVTALKYSKTAVQRDRVLAAQGSSFYHDGKFILAAQCYAQCSASFEEVTLSFIDANERDALRTYLVARLERTKKADLTQRMMLSTWLVEICLSKCNELDDIVASESVSQDVENLRLSKTLVEEELRQILGTYKANLDPDTTYELIQSHGRDDIYLHFASLIGDHVRVIEYWIMAEGWSKAIDALNRQSDLELYYRFSSILMHQAPKDTVDSWIRQPSLDPSRLVPALLRFRSKHDPLSSNQAIRYLNHVIFQQNNTSPIIHNLLITLYVSTASPRSGDEEGPLLRFLATAPSDPLTGKPYYDLDYALRLCIQTNRTRSCVHIYSKMSLWEHSVDLALEKGDLDLAKTNANMPEDDAQLRKKLWLKIAKYVVQDKKDIKSAMAFLEDTDLLKIEDILPFFPDFVVIDDFKDEICAALEGYSAHIDTLKAEMDETTKSAESIKQDIKSLRNRFVVIDSGERCSVCGTSLLTRQFYVFPCQHTLHADCLIGLVKEYLPAPSLRRIVKLQTELLTSSAPTTNTVARSTTQQRSLLSTNFTSSLPNGSRTAGSLGRNILSAGDKLRDLIMPESLAAVISTGMWSTGVDIVGMGLLSSTNEKGEKDDKARKMEKAREELDELLSSSCPVCESAVAGLDKPFLKEGDDDQTWQI